MTRFLLLFMIASYISTSAWAERKADCSNLVEKRQDLVRFLGDRIKSESRQFAKAFPDMIPLTESEKDDRYNKFLSLIPNMKHVLKNNSNFNETFYITIQKLHSPEASQSWIGYSMKKMRFFHGTSKNAYKSILKNGVYFAPGAGEISAGLYLANNQIHANAYATKAERMGETPALLEFFLKPQTRILDMHYGKPAHDLYQWFISQYYEGLHGGLDLNQITLIPNFKAKVQILFPFLKKIDEQFINFQIFAYLLGVDILYQSINYEGNLVSESLLINPLAIEAIDLLEYIPPRKK